ncbi:hypothetical protein LSAT2_010251, partial [Lamellibrachia satsuma]
LYGFHGDPVHDEFNGDHVRESFRGDPVRVGFNGDPVRDAFRGDPLRVGFNGDSVRDAFSGDPVRDGFLGDPVRHSFLRCDCSDLSRCLLLGEMTFSAHSRLRWSTPDGSSLETQQPKLVLSQLPTKTLLERSQSAEAEHEPPTASHCVVFEIILR